MSRSLDAALAIYPRAWRERYADEVRGTLMDVADATGGKVPLTETLPLGFRGLWLRARGSVTFWAGLLIIAAMVVGTGTQYSGFRTDPAWISFAMRVNQGLALALVLASIASGWAGAKARAESLSGASVRLARFWRDSWPVVLSILAGYVVTIVVIVAASGWPRLVPPSWLVLAAQLAVTFLVIAVGYTLGGVLPRVVVIFVAPLVVSTVLLLLFGWQTPWLVASAGGYGVYLGLASVPLAAPFLRVIGIAAVLVAVSLTVVALRPVWARVIPVVVVAAIAVSVAVGVSDAPLVTDPAFVARSQSELVCAGDAPEICLWPEQEASFGAEARSALGLAYQQAIELGLPVQDSGPTAAARLGMAGTGEGYISGLRPEFAVNYYASTFIWDYVEEPRVGDGDSSALMYSIAILLGVPPEEAWPATPDPVTGSPALFDSAEIPDEAAARALVERWLDQGVDGVRQP